MLGFLAPLIPIVVNALSTLTAIAPKVIPWLVEGAKSLLTIVGKHLPTIIDIIDIITDVLSIVDKDKVNSYDLGVKVTETDKKPEDFDSIQDYIKYLQNEVKYEKKVHNESEILTFKAIGGHLLIKGIEEKLKINTSPEFWLEVGRNKLTGQEIIGIISKYSEEGLKLDFSEYLNGKLSPKEEQKRGEFLVNILSSLNPENSKEDIENRLMEMEKNTQSKKEF